MTAYSGGVSLCLLERPLYVKKVGFQYVALWLSISFMSYDITPPSALLELDTSIF